MLRSEIAKNLNLDTETIRFYEKEKLISGPGRLNNGYRSYTRKHVVELKFIQHCRTLGIGLDEIRVLQSLTKPSKDCSGANAIIEKNLRLIEQKIGELKQLHSQLKTLSDSCIDTGSTEDCAIVKSLINAADGRDCACHGHLTSSKDI